MEECLKLNKERSAAIILTATVDAVLMIQMFYFIVKYLKIFGNDRDNFILMAVFFIFFQQFVRFVANVIVAAISFRGEVT